MRANSPFLLFREQKIFWDHIRYLQISPRSIGLILEDQSRLRFDFASPEELDSALSEAFMVNRPELKN